MRFETETETETDRDRDRDRDRQRISHNTISQVRFVVAKLPDHIRHFLQKGPCPDITCT